jgi:hypothetical protein
MSEILLTIAKNTWVIDFAALCIFFVLYLKNKQVTSSLLTMAVALVIGFIVIQYRTLVFAIKSPDAGFDYLIGWCVGFIIADLIMAFVLYRIYASFKNNFGRKAQLAVIVFMAAFMIALVSIQFGPLLFDMEGSSHKLWVRVAYYLGNVVLYTIAIYGIQKLHERNKVAFSIIGRVYIMQLLVATNLQIFRFLERLTWDTNYLEPVYKWGFVSINSCTTAVTLFIATLAIYNHYSRAKRKGVLWNI